MPDPEKPSASAPSVQFLMILALASLVPFAGLYFGFLNVKSYQDSEIEEAQGYVDHIEDRKPGSPPNNKDPKRYRIRYAYRVHAQNFHWTENSAKAVDYGHSKTVRFYRSDPSNPILEGQVSSLTLWRLWTAFWGLISIALTAVILQTVVALKKHGSSTDKQNPSPKT